MNKRGQVQISFGMIFSIVIIIATVAIGFYVINYFLDMSNCTKVGLFWSSLSGEVDSAWNGDKTQTVFNGKVPSGLDYVCFGNLSAGYLGGDSATAKAFNELVRYSGNGKNSFLYPVKEACDNAFYDLKHAKFDSFFCVPVKSGTASIKLSMTSFDKQVTLSKP